MERLCLVLFIGLVAIVDTSYSIQCTSEKNSCVCKGENFTIDVSKMLTFP